MQSLLGVAAPLCAQTPKQLRDAERVAARFEEAETEGDASIQVELWEQVERSLDQTEAYLESHPDDPTALLLYVRLGRITVSAEQSEFTVCDGAIVPLDTTDQYAPLHMALDRMLALEPSNAEAHYWKARIRGTQS